MNSRRFTTSSHSEGRVELPDELLDYCKGISPAYTYTRYPDVVESSELRGKIDELFEQSEEVLEWIEKRI